MADQRQVADHVEDLVAHELVFEAQRVQHAGVADDDGVLERAAERQAVLAQPLHFLQEAEGARRGDVSAKLCSVIRSVRDWCRSSGWSKLMV